MIIFLAIGALLFLLDRFLRAEDERTIELNESEVETIAARWLDQMGRQPLPAELAGLVEERVQEAMMIQEAKRLGLADDDVIIHRRLIQKLRFLVEDAAVADPAAREAVETYFKSHRSRYDEPATISFSHVFYGSDAVNDATVWKNLLHRLNTGDRSDSIGESFLLGKEFKDVSFRRVKSDFGDAFLGQIRSIDVDGDWQGPYTSRYGVHLVRVDEVNPARKANFEDVFDRVRNDYDLERRDEAFEAYLAQLRKDYNIVLPSI